MKYAEKLIYHQIHPVKLITDFGTGFASTYLLWQQMLVTGLCLAFIPSLLVSMVLLARGNFEKYRNSAFGAYAKKYLNTPTIDGVRFAGFFLMLYGGYNHEPWIIAAGVAIVAWCWLRGLIFPRTS